jgi:16S rRNA (cytidine1402-2'-O)-methyltransferase
VLYIVAGPIGNLKDITLRAIETLKEVDIVACEDTRQTGKLLSALNIKKPMISCRSENEETAAARIVEEILGGASVAYLTDAGTPGVSDPGYRLVRTARNADIPVLPIPGPSAMTTLLSVEGYGGKSVLFEGFLSPKPGKRRRRLEELLEMEARIILYESPHRILKLLEEICAIEPDRPLLIGREMTKIYEEYIEGSAQQIFDELKVRKSIKGEFCILVGMRRKR